MPVNNLFFARDFSGVDTDFISFPEEVYHLEYSGAGSKNITIPTAARYVIVTVSTGSVHYAVKLGTGAAIGTTDITDGTGNILNLERFVVPSSTTQISIAASGACKITLGFYKFQ